MYWSTPDLPGDFVTVDGSTPIGTHAPNWPGVTTAPL